MIAHWMCLSLHADQIKKHRGRGQVGRARGAFIR